MTRSVLVIGNGIVGLAAAIALRRALPGALVTLIALPPDPDGWIDRLGAVSPVIHKFHRQIGLEPRHFFQRASAEPVHLRRYLRAGRPDRREACIPAIPFVEGVPLHHIWLRHHAACGEDAPDFAAMLLALRDARGDDGGFGVRFDPASYAELLRSMAAALGIVRRNSAELDIQIGDDGIRYIVPSAGEALTADLYVDAAGPRSRLLAALGARRDDGSARIPGRALTVTPGGRGRASEEVLAMTPEGLDWQTRQWRATVALAAGAPPPGRLAQSWKANAVAIGESAFHAPVCDGMLLGFALDDILRLVSLLPRPDSAGRDIAEYNRRAAIAQESLADWSSLCFGADAADHSESLAATLAAFDARGRVASRELDPIAPGQWLARLMALRPLPRRIDPTALALSEDIVRTTIARAAEAAATGTPQ